MNNGLLYFPRGEDLAGGRLLQVAETQDRNGDSTALVFASADTIPQITEGKEYTALNTRITPLSNRSRLLIEAMVYCRPAVGTNCAIGVWRDALPNCLVFALESVAANSIGAVALRFFMPSPGVNPILFTVRFGVNVIATTVGVSSSATPNWGGTQYSSLRISEYFP